MGASPDLVLSQYVQQLIRAKAHYLARRPGFSRCDEEDLRQEITTRLLGRVHHFDPGRASLNTFVDRVVASLVISILRERHRQKRAPGNRALSLEAHAVSAEDGCKPLREQVQVADVQRRTVGSAGDMQDAAERDSAVRAAMSRLSPQLQRICERLMHVPAATAARQLGLTRHQLLKAVKALRVHFRAAGLE